MIWEYDCTALHMVEKVHSCEHRPAVLAKDIWNEMKVVKWNESCEMKDLEIYDKITTNGRSWDLR